MTWVPQVRNTMIAGSLALLTGCSENMNNQDKGELIGAAVGATIGLAIGDDLGLGDAAGELVAIGLGSMAGAIIGGSIGAKLDEIDRLKAELATVSALEMEEDTTVEWKSSKNKDVSGSVSTSAIRKTASAECKKVSHVMIIRGQEYREEDTLCRQDNGSWALS